MGKILIVGFLGICSLFGCATQQPADGELADIYLSTLNDKHFVWCTLDLDQCKKDIHEWKNTEHGRTLIREYEKGGASNKHHTLDSQNTTETADRVVIPTKYGPDRPAYHD